MRHRLRRDPVERDKDRQALACWPIGRSFWCTRASVQVTSASFACCVLVARMRTSSTSSWISSGLPIAAADRVTSSSGIAGDHATQGRQVFTTNYQHYVHPASQPTAQSSANRSSTKNDVAGMFTVTWHSCSPWTSCCVFVILKRPT